MAIAARPWRWRICALVRLNCHAQLRIGPGANAKLCEAAEEFVLGSPGGFGPAFGCAGLVLERCVGGRR